MQRICYGLVGTLLLLWSGQARATLVSHEGVAGYYSNDDGYSHAVIATTGGTIEECWWITSSTSPPGCTALVTGITWFTIASISGFYSADHYRHAVVVGTDGEVWDWSYTPGVSGYFNLIDTLSVSTYGIPTTSASYYSPDGNYHYVIGTSTGNVVQYRVNPTGGFAFLPIGSNYGSPVMNVSAYYLSSNEHMTALTNSGTGWNLYFSTYSGATSSSTPRTVYWNDTSGSYSAITWKSVADDATRPTVTWANTGAQWGHSNYNAYFSDYEGTVDYSFFYDSLKSYGAFFEAGNSTYHGLTGTTTANDVWDMRRVAGTSTVTYIYLGSF